MDVQRIAIIGAEAKKRRSELPNQRGQRRQIFRRRPFPDQHLHAFRQLLPSLGQVSGLVTVTNTAGEIGVQVVTGNQRRMAVDMLALKRGQLFHALGIFVQHPRHIHELGQADHLGMVAMGRQIRSVQPGPRCLEIRRRNTGRELHPQIERRVAGGIEEILQTLEP